MEALERPTVHKATNVLTIWTLVGILLMVKTCSGGLLNIGEGVGFDYLNNYIPLTHRKVSGGHLNLDQRH